MRVRGRRAAIGATTMALVLAATGSSLAAVRAAVSRGGVATSGVALPAPSMPRAGPVSTLPPPTDSFVPDVVLPPVQGTAGATVDPTTALPAAGAVAGAASAPPAPGPAVPAPAARQPAVATAARTATPLVTLPPASGPTPTTQPSPSTAACPSITGKGALPVRGGGLQAVDFTLRFPAAAPLVLVPQASATRSAGAAVRIATTTAPQMAVDGTSLTLPAPLAVTYVLQSGQERARGTITFSTVAAPNVFRTRTACRGSSFALYDVEQATLQGSALRVVGMVAPTGTVTISADGGIAFFRSSVRGTHTVTLLTANDAGAAGDVVTVTVTVA